METKMFQKKFESDLAKIISNLLLNKCCRSNSVFLINRFQTIKNTIRFLFDTYIHFKRFSGYFVFSNIWRKGLKIGIDWALCRLYPFYLWFPVKIYRIIIQCSLSMTAVHTIHICVWYRPKNTEMHKPYQRGKWTRVGLDFVTIQSGGPEII